MLGTEEENGNGAVRVPYGEDGKSLTMEQAVALLSAMQTTDEDKGTFGYYLSWGITGVKPHPPTRRQRV